MAQKKYFAPKPPKASGSSPHQQGAQKSIATTFMPLSMLSEVEKVRFVLKSGTVLDADVQSLSEERVHLHGQVVCSVLGALLDGARFSVDWQNIDYITEVTEC